MPWHIKRTAILFSTARTLGFIGVCDIFSIVLCPFVRFPSARLGVHVIRRCDIKCDIALLRITSYFLSNIVHTFFIFYTIYLRNINV